MLAAPAAHAQQLIQNGGFETGSLNPVTDWGSFNPNGPSIISVRVFPTTEIVGLNADGNFFVDLGAPGYANENNGASIEQTVTGITGASLTLSFWYAVEYNSSDPVSASTPALGVTVVDYVTSDTVFSENYNQLNFGGTSGITTSTWNVVTVNFTPTTSNPLIVRFTDLSTTGTDPMLDDVSLTQVPEPSTVSLLGLGLIGAFGLRRRKAVHA
jgi:hypothetical protein